MTKPASARLLSKIRVMYTLMKTAAMVPATGPPRGGLGTDWGGGADEDDEDKYALGRQIDTPPKIWPENMTEIIATIVRSTSERPESPLFKFEMNGAAAESNFLVLRKFNFDLEKALKVQVGSPVGYGSEFQKGELLLPLLKNHPLWNRMKEMLAHGSKWPTKSITEEDRAADLIEALKFGNHKGASNQPELLLKLVSGDVKFGYALPLPLGKIKRIPGICMAPLNIQPQWTINERGEIIEKDRLTHDQSFEWERSESSVNSRTDTSQLQQCKFGKCLLRLINWAVSARKKYPNRRIMAKKDDFKSAYRRLHLHSETALRATTQLPELELALMSLRLTFGGAPGPYEWSVISETICDLTTAINTTTIGTH